MEIFSLILFVCLGAGSLLSGILVIAHRSPLVSIFSLVANALCVAGIFLLLGDPFLAMVQVVVYAGAILVLFLFVVMLLDVRRDDLPGGGGKLRRVLLTFLILAFGLALGAAACAAFLYGPAAAAPLVAASPALLSRLLFGRYVLSFEVVSVLLLAAMLGIAMLTLRRPSASGDGQGPGGGGSS